MDCVKKGYVLEGFPQTREQALALQSMGIHPKHCGRENAFAMFESSFDHLLKMYIWYNYGIWELQLHIFGIYGNFICL